MSNVRSKPEDHIKIVDNSYGNPTEKTPLLNQTLSSINDSGSDHIAIDILDTIEDENISCFNSLESWAEETTFRRLVVKPFISGARSVKEHPVYSFLSFVFSLPGGINAFCMAKGIKPEDLMKELPNLSSSELFVASGNAFCSIAVNTPMNAVFLPQTVDGLFNNFKDFYKNPTLAKLMVNATSSLIASSAAISTFGIGFSSFLFLGQYFTLLPYLFGLVNAINNFASRFTGAQGIIDRLRTYNTLKDAKTMLTHLDNKFVGEIENKLKDKKLNDETITELFNSIDELAQTNKDLFRDKSAVEMVQESAYFLLKLSLALTAASFVFITFNQTGFNGLNALEKLFGSTLEDLPLAAKGSIGTLPGIASAIFYGFNLFDLTDVLIESLHVLQQTNTHSSCKFNVAESTQTAALTGICAVSGNAMANVSENVVKKEGNNFSLSPDNAFAKTYEGGNYLFAALLNLKVLLQLTLANTKSLESKISPNLQDALTYLRRKKLNTTVSNELSQLSIFSKQKNMERELLPLPPPPPDARNSFLV